MDSSLATFAAGCFWGVEARFREIVGVISVEVGYTGGHTTDPDYRSICAGDTGHAEAVRLAFDSSQVSYDDLLDAFWNLHDPTQKNRQGPDRGSQYRSAIFYHSDEQRDQAERSLARLRESGVHAVTEIEPARQFWRAEEYHQRYLEKAGRV